MALTGADLGFSVPLGELHKGWAGWGRGMCRGQKLTRVESPIFPAEKKGVPWQRRHQPERWGTKMFENQTSSACVPAWCSAGWRLALRPNFKMPRDFARVVLGLTPKLKTHLAKLV